MRQGAANAFPPSIRETEYDPDQGLVQGQRDAL
ncbi:hypothetical protein MPLDJ20_310016 [Mesorhizobium plurifarium]|uniref:Uncharacterized protein n=1 Tax=Mesorhizobium plurifarium TaxID=69974 RepID=A0A090GNM1_MESPL|nr:hypothetical protein MPLDJ20_310016 [Mesorhizobium plurifarium]